MSKLRIVIIGAGTMGRRHIEYVKASGECQLVGICDSDSGVAELAAKVEAPFFHDAFEALDLAAPDGAIIAAPTNLHEELALACIRRGIVPLVEKPVTAALDEGRRVVDAAGAAGVPVLVGHHRRYHPRIRRLWKLVKEGAIGSLIGVSLLWAVKKPDAYYDIVWRTRAGGGPVLTNLIHEIDTLRYVCGEITSVYAATSSATRGFEVEDSAAITLRFSGGVVGSIFLSDAAPSPWSYELTMFENPSYAHVAGNFAFFFGTGGSIAFPTLELWRYPCADNAGWEHPLEQEQHEPDDADPLAAQLAHFCRVIRREEPPLVSGEEGLRTLAATQAVLTSGSEGIPVELRPV
ncbi:MAG: Gfo/Idh/MocA family oxidoreductase [Caldilineaceae bacterium SB0670_bin_27]|uniref:Gfo/Idh/MocA family oxidoreductase n=1 Tax=Caldilineaceae bacterium SB0664_bin_27 TaxID=2605260 RepID=A0A6B0YRR4_9CHLR|nr:Gfo/Idh/MocA family oxidoreductase [Caldilineaceae bacterium SB0664_bin_27]MYJ79604.1 Gfo/Idh/MocA family oxidoreductase [Caldilineaceae bacterium SB0670_bin_27]